MGGSSGFWQRKKRPKTPEDYYRERCDSRERRAARARQYAPLAVTVDMVADRDRLYELFANMRGDAGPAPGPDGITYAALTNSEAGVVVGNVAADLKEGCYRPWPPRVIHIPKPGGRGRRRLSLGNVLDRVVAASLLAAVQEHAERLFLPCSWGYRPGRGAWGMLLAVERAVADTGRRVVVNCDIKAAFDSVPVKEVLACHEEMIAGWPLTDIPGREREREREAGRLLDLVRTVLQAGSKRRRVGIPQGNPYSPLCLNLLLTKLLDRPLTATMTPPVWFRYADNMAYLCHTVSEGRKVLREIRRRLLPLGMALKGGADVCDLQAGGETELLGFTLSLTGDVMAYGLGDGAVDHLRESLLEAHYAFHSADRAEQALSGWIDACGPALAGDGDLCGRIVRTLASLGFHHLCDPRALATQLRAARHRWLAFRNTTAAPPTA